MDPLDLLPLEVSLSVLKYLDIYGLSAASQVSILWMRIIQENDRLWVPHCLQHCHSEYIKRDRLAGYTWKDTLYRNYGSRRLIRDWLCGVFSHAKAFHQLPPRHMAVLDADTWGDIMEAEFTRDTAPAGE